MGKKTHLDEMEKLEEKREEKMRRKKEGDVEREESKKEDSSSNDVSPSEAEPAKAAPRSGTGVPTIASTKSRASKSSVTLIDADPVSSAVVSNSKSAPANIYEIERLEAEKQDKRNRRKSPGADSGKKSSSRSPKDESAEDAVKTS